MDFHGHEVQAGNENACGHSAREEYRFVRGILIHLGERVEVDVGERHVTAKHFHAVDVNNATIVSQKEHSEIPVKSWIRHVEPLTEIVGAP